MLYGDFQIDVYIDAIFYHRLNSLRKITDFPKTSYDVVHCPLVPKILCAHVHDSRIYYCDVMPTDATICYTYAIFNE